MTTLHVTSTPLTGTDLCHKLADKLGRSVTWAHGITDDDRPELVYSTEADEDETRDAASFWMPYGGWWSEK